MNSASVSERDRETHTYNLHLYIVQYNTPWHFPRIHAALLHGLILIAGIYRKVHTGLCTLILCILYIRSTTCDRKLNKYCNQAHCKEIWIYVFPEKESLGRCPNYHIMCLWAIYTVYFHVWPTYFLAAELADRSQIYENGSQKHECRNWDCSRAVPFLEIFVLNFRYCVFAVHVAYYSQE